MSRLPQLHVKVSDVNALGFSVNLARTNPVHDRERRIYAPRYPKPQTEGYFVMVSDAAKGDVIALKRVSWPSAEKTRSANTSKPTTRSFIKLPESGGERKMKVQVVSDSYIGMEWQVDDVDVPAPPKIVDDGGKKPQ